MHIKYWMELKFILFLSYSVLILIIYVILFYPHHQSNPQRIYDTHSLLLCCFEVCVKLVSFISKYKKTFKKFDSPPPP